MWVFSTTVSQEMCFYFSEIKEICKKIHLEFKCTLREGNEIANAFGKHGIDKLCVQGNDL